MTTRISDLKSLPFQTFISLLALVAVASAANPGYAPAPSYKETPALYSYQYGVDAQDGYNGYVRFGADESRDGYATKGSYNVLLPDGRTQIVSYNTADAYSGNVMDVKYEGKASYAPVHAPVHGKGYHPEPIHKPIVHKPVYHAEPIHKAPIYHA